MLLPPSHISQVTQSVQRTSGMCDLNVSAYFVTHTHTHTPFWRLRLSSQTTFSWECHGVSSQALLKINCLLTGFNPHPVDPILQQCYEPKIDTQSLHQTRNEFQHSALTHQCCLEILAGLLLCPTHPLGQYDIFIRTQPMITGSDLLELWSAVCPLDQANHMF